MLSRGEGGREGVGGGGGGGEGESEDEDVTMAERGAGGQQHLEDAKEGLQKREGAGISDAE